MMRILFVFLIGFFQLPLAWAQMGSFCEELVSRDAQEVPGYEDVKDVCQAEFETYSGSFVFVERGFVPFPNQFYYKLPGEREIEMSSAQLIRTPTQVDWPFGVVRISSIERSGSQYADSFDKIKHSVLAELSERCELPVKLFKYVRTASFSVHEAHFYELQLGNTTILISGEAQALLLAMADAYTRLNCSETSLEDSEYEEEDL